MNTLALEFAPVNPLDNGFFPEACILDTEAASWAAHLADEQAEADAYTAWLNENATELAEAAVMNAAYESGCWAW